MCVNRAIETELQLKHTREARWMFQKALESLPLHSRLWIDVSGTVIGVVVVVGLLWGDLWWSCGADVIKDIGN